MTQSGWLKLYKQHSLQHLDRLHRIIFCCSYVSSRPLCGECSASCWQLLGFLCVPEENGLESSSAGEVTVPRRLALGKGIAIPCNEIPFLNLFRRCGMCC